MWSSRDPLPMQRNVKVQNKAAIEEAVRLEVDEIAEGSGLRFGTCIQAMAAQGIAQILDTETSPTCLRFSACLRPRVCGPRSVRRCDCRPVGGRGTRMLSSTVAGRCCVGCRAIALKISAEQALILRGVLLHWSAKSVFDR